MVEDNETFGIIGMAQRVHSTLGFGFLEKVYQDALEIEFQEKNVLYIREARIDIFYRDKVLGCPYFADFLCYGDIIVELKALKRISKVDESQIIHYLKATDKHRGLLLNFGAPSLEVKRFVNGVLQIDNASVLACDSTKKSMKSVKSAVKQ